MQKAVHFVGIGGIGISALARYYISLDWRVTGSDAVYSDLLDELRRDGIRVSVGHRASNVVRPEFVVYSAAVRPENPELQAARKRGIRTLSYAEALGELTKHYYTIAISGSHGKSTTTAFIGLILIRAGLDPTIIVGTKLHELGGSNFRKGKSEYLVIEADEWNRSFHHYYPSIAVITNVDKEHLDTYKTYAGVIKGFAKYLKNTQPKGAVIANAKDRGVRRVIANNANRFRNNANKVVWFNKSVPHYPLGIPGAHNQANADAAWSTARFLGIKKSVADAVFKNYHGAWRRLEKFHVIGHKSLAATVYSDYAHHPSEILATLQALRERYPKKQLVCVFEPHHADRLTQLFPEFTRAFREADKLILLPVYRVKGRDDEYQGKTSLDLAHAIHKPNVFFAPSYEVAFNMLGSDLLTDAVIVFMSAGTLDEAMRKFFDGKE